MAATRTIASNSVTSASNSASNNATIANNNDSRIVMIVNSSDSRIVMIANSSVITVEAAKARMVSDLVALSKGCTNLQATKETKTTKHSVFYRPLYMQDTHALTSEEQK